MIEETTNSFGGCVMPTISADEYKGAQQQKDLGGVRPPSRSFNFELYANPERESIDALCARRCHDWLVY